MTIWKAMLLTFACCAGAGARAQDTHTWTDIDCAQLRIPAAIGLKCRGLNYAGINPYVTESGGTFRQSNASGTINKAKLLYILFETTSLQSGVSTRSTLPETLKSSTAQAKAATNFSEVTTRDGVDFVTFTGSTGDACVGVRRLGTARLAGYKWIVYATRCVSAKTPVPDADIAAFIASTKPSS
jgi:hypothetical protein